MTDSRRIAPAPPADSETARALEERIRAARGDISPLYRTLLHSLPVAHGWEQLLTAVRQKTSLSPRLRELVILRVAVTNRAPYEFEAHVAHAKKAGLSDAEIRSVAEGNDAPFTGEDRLVLDYTDAMTRDVHVPDALFERIKDAYPPRLRVELTATIAAYNMVSRFLVALDVH